MSCTATASSSLTTRPTATRREPNAPAAHAPARGRGATVAPASRALRSSGTFTAAPVRMPCARSRTTPARAQRMMVFASKNTIIAGAPASGKGTQCEFIVENYGLTHISTGDMLREAVKAGTDAGKSAKEYMDAGKLVPDEVIIAMVKDRLGEADCKENGWLLDGFPRTGAQAEALVDIGVSPDYVLLLDVPDEQLIKRVVGRRSDPETGKIYHVDFFPPPADIADRCIQRSDDTEEACKKRLEYFYANLEAIKVAYADKLLAIDGNQDKMEVAGAIKKAMA